MPRRRSTRVTARTRPIDMPRLGLPWHLQDRGLFIQESALSESRFQDLAKDCGLPIERTLLRWYQSVGVMLPALILDGERHYSRWQLLELRELEEWRQSIATVRDWISIDQQDRRSWRKAITAHPNALFCGRPEYRQWLSLLVLIQNKYIARARGHLNESRLHLSLGDEEWAEAYMEREYPPRIGGDAPLREIGLDLDAARKLRQRVGLGLQREDPLRQWYRLVRFVPMSWRERLTGSARLTQELYIADRTLQRYLSDVSGMPEPDLEDLDGRPSPVIHALYGRTIDYRDPDFRELILTQFGLHPAARGWIFAEGPTEVALLGAIFEMFGYPLKNLGVKIESLEGVNNVPRMLEVVDRLRRPVTTGGEVGGHKMIQRPVTPVWIVVDREGPIASKVIPELKKRQLEHCLVVADRDLERDNFASELPALLEKQLGEPVSPEKVAEWVAGQGPLDTFVKRQLKPAKRFRKLDLVAAYTDLLRADIEAGSADVPFQRKFLNDALAILRIILHDLPNPDPALKDLATL